MSAENRNRIPTLLRLEDGATIVSRLEKLSEEDPDKPAFIFWDKSRKRTVLTRRDVWDKSLRFAAVLRRWGVVKGDIVCNILANSPQRLITMYGTILCGAVTMHGQLFLSDGEDILANWKDSQCKAVILDPLQKNGAASILNRRQYKDADTGTTRYKDLPYLTHIIPVLHGKDTTNWDQFLEDEDEKYTDHSITETDAAFVLTTSGTTGFAKLVPHSHKTILGFGITLTACIGNKAEGVYFNYRSLGWMAGSPATYPVLGKTRVLVDLTQGHPTDMGTFMVDIINHEKVSSALLMGADIQLIVNTISTVPECEIGTQLDLVFTAGGPISEVTMSAIGHLTKKISAGYASTECGIMSAVVVDDPKSYESCFCGYAGELVECKVMGKGGEEEVGVGQNGDIYVRGPTIASCYLNKPGQTKESFLPDGWFRTSDIGYLNDKGELFVFCRKSNAINHKGYIHYPGWMESRINRHPHIQKSIVVAIPDPVTHDELCLCLMTSPQSNLTSNDVKEFCKSLYVTSELDSITPIPKHVLFFDAFPLNSNGKIDRKTLKAKAMERLEIVQD